MQLVLLAWNGGTGVWGGEPGSGPLSWSETGETDKAESILGRKENTGRDLEVVHGDGPLEMGLWSPHALPSSALSSLRKCEAAQGLPTRFHLRFLESQPFLPGLRGEHGSFHSVLQGFLSGPT